MAIKEIKVFLSLMIFLSIPQADADVPFGCENQFLPNYFSGVVERWIVEFDGASAGAPGTGSFSWLWTDEIQRDNVMTDFRWDFGADRQGGVLDTQSELLPDGTLVSRFSHGIPVFEMLTGLSTEWRDPPLVVRNISIEFGSSIVHGTFPNEVEERIIFSAGLLSSDNLCYESLATYSFQHSGQTYSGHMIFPHDSGHLVKLPAQTASVFDTR